MAQEKTIAVTITFTFDTRRLEGFSLVERFVRDIGMDTATFAMEGDAFSTNVTIKAFAEDVLRGSEAVAVVREQVPLWVRSFDSRVAADKDSIIEGERV